MQYNYRILIGFIAWVFLSVSSALAQTEEENGAVLAAALQATSGGDWATAAQLAGRINDPAAGDIVEWIRLRDGGAYWSDYQAFLRKNPDWPGLKLLRKRGEAAMPVKHTPAKVFDYFDKTLPQSGIGVLRLTEAYISSGKADLAKAEAIRAWRNFSMTKDERVQLLARFEQTLADHHIARLDMLLWRNLSTQAKGLYTLVPDGHVKLAKARLGLRKKVNGVDALIAAIPSNLKDDPGLAYERFLWRTKKGLYDSARDLLVNQSTSAARLGRPDIWSGRRRTVARQEMRDGNNHRAYTIASTHFLTKGSDFADLEWLSGYIALRKLNDPQLALWHFDRFKAAVATPISFGRAGYWQGRAFEALQDQANAVTAYKFAAAHQTSFYGQLAAEKIRQAPDTTLVGNEQSPDWRQAGFANSSIIRAAILFHYANQPHLSERFIRHLGESQDRVGIQQLADLASEMGRPNIVVRLSKQAARQGHVLPKSYFPITPLAKKRLKVDPEVAMSIARRESELDQFVISPAGARGLMQLMPSTAQKVAKDIGVVYSLGKLTSDWEYNANLGSTYLAEQLADFDGSYILAFAAYNAGPHRARRWIARYGDPRDNNLDQIDWIEHIPFRETRNYVMRVIESLHVYRARINGRTPKLEITKDLQKG